jgi:soluble lytic murein transglycosylase-like protein
MAQRAVHGRKCKALTVLVGLAAGAVLAARAEAQVLEVQPDGSVVTFNGPAVRSGHASIPISPPRTAGSPAPDRSILMRQIGAASIHHGLSPALVEAVGRRESGLDPRARSPKGAVGVMQLMPATAATLGVQPTDAAANIDGGAAYLALMLRRFDGDLMRALAAYNAGPEAVERYGGTPPYAETKAYVAGVLDRLADISLGQVATKGGAKP